MNVEGKESEATERRSYRKRDDVSGTSQQTSTPATATFYTEHRNKLELNCQLLGQPLSAKNYKEKFHHLLYWEQHEHERQLSERCNSESYYDITILEVGFAPHILQYESDENYDRFGYITSEDNNALEHAKQATEASSIYLGADSFAFAKHVHGSLPTGVDSNGILIAFTKVEHEKLKALLPYGEMEYTFRAKVKFEIQHFYFNQLHRSLEHLPSTVICRLNPTKRDIACYQKEVFYKVSRPIYRSLELDQLVQMNALYTILKSPPTLPVLISGPFGTGKTRLLARAAYEILKNSRKSRVLICAYQQASLDTFLNYFGAIKIEDVKNPWSINFIRVIPNESMKRKSKTRRKYSCFVKTKAELSSRDLESSRLIITTFNTSAALYHKIPAGRKNGFFTDILMDEGAQTREPETVIPLSLAGTKTRIVIAGDHCQVGPKSVVLGEEAQSNGLGTSLLERLHTLYANSKMPRSRSCSVALLINHRCHSGILMLPSSLYYHSTLQCRVPDSTAHHLAPFPLTFVCSDIKQDVKGTSGINEIEAEVIIKEVRKYFTKWPKHWDREDRRICIMSPSASQCAVLRKKASKIETDVQIEVLNAYNIQGNEFRAVFISTSEATNEDGKPLNEPRSLCDRYVFNTALTRSQSLVVAVGNPFSLLKTEAHMIEVHGDTYKTWTLYMQQCVECSTFSYATSIKKSDPSSIVDATHQIYNCIYSDSVFEGDILESFDGIVEAYQKMFEGIRACQNAKKLLSSNSTRDKKYHQPRKEVRFSEHYFCTLIKQTYRIAEGIPEDTTKEIVQIRGSYNLRGAFDGERVEVGVFEDSPHGEYHGRVKREKSRLTDEKRNLNFVCRVSEYDSNVFYPIDGKNPKFFNLRILTKVVLKNEEEPFHGLKSNVIVVFDPNSYRGQSLPRIVRVIPRSVAEDMLFIVSFVKWGKDNVCPLGIVTGACRKGHTLYNAEHLLKLEHSIKYSPQYDDEFYASSADQDMNADLAFYDRAFTIDPDKAKNLDDALSITRLDADENVYKLGVHIVNAAKHIERDTEVDNSARNIGISVYGGNKGEIKHMLRDADTRRKLSLTPGKVRDVISVTCNVTIAPDLEFGETSITQAQIKSAIQLTYEQAQEIMDGIIPIECSDKMRQFDTDPHNPSLHDSLQLLKTIIKRLRLERLESDAAYAYRVNEPEEVKCWQAHLLVEELMIWANNQVAMFLHSHYPDTALLCRQPPPKSYEQKKEEILNNHANIMACSLNLSQHLNGNGYVNAANISIHIPLYTLKLIHDALRREDKNLLIHLLSSDRLYPQFAAIFSQFRSISLRAEYCCTDSGKDLSEYRHHDLHLNGYTHFTSPMRRYIDIEVQRMLLAEILHDEDEREFTHDQQSELCIALNAAKRKASEYEKKARSIRLASELLSNTKSCTAFISKENKGMVELDFPNLEFRHFSPRNKSLKITNFIPSAKESGIYVWKLHVTSLKSDLAGAILMPGISLVRARSNDELKDEGDAFCTSDEMSLDIKKFTSSHDGHVVKVPTNCWLKIQEFVKDPTGEKMKRVKEILPQVSSLSSCSSLVLDTVKKKCAFLDCNVKTSLKQSDVLKLWLTWSTRDPWVTSAVQLVEISPLLRICVQHNSHPAECFSDPKLLNASKEFYCNIKEYIELWKKVLLAEAAEKSVQECQPVIIRDVSLQWPELKMPEKCIEEIYYVPDGSVQMVLPVHFIEHCYEFFRIGVGDLVCVRYGCDSHQSVRAVYHFVVNHVDQLKEEEKPTEITISMGPVGEINCRVSEVMKSKLESETCEVQIVRLGYSYRKVFRGLLALSSIHVSKLSQDVAVKIKRKRDSTNSIFRAAGISPMNHRCHRIAESDVLAQSISGWTAEQSTKNLNEYQKEAMYRALDNRFQLIQGPPGTGKSVTGARIAYVFAESNKPLNSPKSHKCVIYCGPSNKSVDVVFENFVELLKVREGLQLRILRIYSSAVERKDFPGPKYHTLQQEPNTTCPDWAKPYALHHMIRESGRSSELAQLEQKLKTMRENNKIATGKLCNEYRRVLNAAEENFLLKEKFDVIFCTCNEASGGRIRRYKSLSPRQCIIDECGMAYEPETIVPIGLCEHVVLIGDHKQLQPVIDYQPAKNAGLTTSLFERYATHHEDRLYALELQYRMHRAICSFPSKEFYESKLKTDESVLKRTANPSLEWFWPKGNSAPIMFVDVVGKEGQDIANSKRETRVGVDSKYNEKEAELVIEIAKILLTVHKVQLNEIAVLSPYSAQKNQILKMVRERTDELKDLKVASITESQGNEYGIVILSTVRSKPLHEFRHPDYMEHDHLWMRENLGFITDKHQINVGITRSKYGLVIAGNKTLLAYDETWERLLKHYSDKGCVVDVSRFIPHAAVTHS